MINILGIILIGIGVFMCGLACAGFTYTTTGKVVDLGQYHATREKTHKVPLPPTLGVVVLIAGVTLLVVRRKE